MDYTILCFEDVLRLITERLRLDTTRSRSQTTDSFLTQWSSQLKDLTEGGRHPDLLHWLDHTGCHFRGKELLERFGIQVQATITKMYSLSFTSSALRDTASTQSSSSRTGAVASSGSSTAPYITSFSSSGKTISSKTTPDTSFETDARPGIFKHYVRRACSPSAIAGAERLSPRSDDQATRKRKRAQSSSHMLHRPADTAVSPPDDPKNDAKLEHGGAAHHKTCPDDMPNTCHRLRDLPTSGFGTVAEHDIAQSIDEAFKTKIERHSDMARPLVLTVDIKIDFRSGKPLFNSSFDVRDMKRSNQLERRFGWKRFMYASLPVESKRHIRRSDQPVYHEQVLSWLMKPKIAFGCEWRAFLIRDSKVVRKSTSTRDAIVPGSNADKRMELVLFATNGLNLDHITIEDFVRSTLHTDLSRNAAQACLKLYSRFEILLSRTAEGVTFEPTQFRFADDPTPTTEHDSHEERALTDTNMSTSYEARKYVKDESMTDGNAMISVGAALLICKALGLTSLPTAFQGRILGVKGVWYISAPYSTRDCDHTGVWIQVHKSQRKIFMDPNTAHCTELAFNVTSISFKPKAADIHRDFLPILQDRGVTFETISSLHIETTRDSVETWSRALKRPAELVQLLYARLGSAGPRHTNGVFKPWALTPAETALHFIEKGFMPCDNQYVADLVLRTFASALADDLVKFRIKCPRSTSMMGITDPYGVLEAHQVFFCFSTPFNGGEGNEAIHCLRDGDEVILARDPTLRPSDMQKFVYCFKPQLVHLQDVVVFSTKGRMPSAAKLQGGDYDGDVFSLLWEPRLTQAFKNVAPPEPKEYQHLGVGKINTTFEELITDTEMQHSVDHFLEMAFRFRMQSNLLGVVTNYANSLTYHHGLRDPRAIELADLHSYLIDSRKNGYIFGEEDWRMFQRRRELKVFEPQAWKTNQERLKDLLEWQPAKDDRNLEQKLRDFLRQAVASEKYNFPSIHDRLWFGPMLVEAADAIEKLGYVLAKLKPKDIDSDLTAPLAALGLRGKDLREVLNPAREQLKAVLNSYWLTCSKGLDDRNDRYQKMQDDFLRIPAPECFTGGRRRLAAWAYSEWEVILATLLLRLQGDHGGRRSVLFIATGPICFIKEHSETGRRRIEEIAAVKRPRPHLIREMSFEAEEEEGTEDEEFSIPSSMLESSTWSQ